MGIEPTYIQRCSQDCLTKGVGVECAYFIFKKNLFLQVIVVINFKCVIFFQTLLEIKNDSGRNIIFLEQIEFLIKI